MGLTRQVTGLGLSRAASLTARTPTRAGQGVSKSQGTDPCRRHTALSRLVAHTHTAPDPTRIDRTDSDMASRADSDIARYALTRIRLARTTRIRRRAGSLYTGRRAVDPPPVGQRQRPPRVPAHHRRPRARGIAGGERRRVGLGLQLAQARLHPLPARPRAEGGHGGGPDWWSTQPGRRETGRERDNERERF